LSALLWSPANVIRESGMPKVTIVGAGIAGLSAALRLLERGFDVTVLEQNEFLGGKLGAHKAHQIGCADDGYIHEHCYHMYVNWYHNFWRIMGEIGAAESFDPQPAWTYLWKDQFNRPRQVQNAGSPLYYWRNVFSGVLSPADMILYGYSLIDLIG